ncbi:hypothetical protein FALBO_15919 [Fusarium albosuccineum]|uniref:Uncharacterized protein n=1 Tax=Fusarium albosuccineum TaxID=1237068 RepID=A0A8H4KQJ8_9HYPO|nr:hypothetical protein FALBO_15919 [Fusarium albosuccineum]
MDSTAFANLKAAQSMRFGTPVSNGPFPFIVPASLDEAGAADMSAGDEGLSLIEDCPLKRDLIAFVDAERPAPDESPVPIDAFVADSSRTDWHTHCPKIKEMWKGFCQKVSIISGSPMLNSSRQLENGSVRFVAYEA